ARTSNRILQAKNPQFSSTPTKSTNWQPEFHEPAQLIIVNHFVKSPQFHHHACALQCIVNWLCHCQRTIRLICPSGPFAQRRERHSKEVSLMPVPVAIAVQFARFVAFFFFWWTAMKQNQKGI